MKRKFIMMKFEASLFGVAKAGSILALTYDSQKQHSYSPPYPVHFIHFYPCMVYYNVPDSNGLASE